MLPISPIHPEVAEIAVPTIASLRPTTRWLNVLSHLDPKYGGLSTIVPQLCASLSCTGRVTADLAAFCLPAEHHRPVGCPSQSITFWPTSRSVWWNNQSLRSRFESAVAETDGVHIHGLWEQSTNIAAHTARSLRKPYIISAHGMLEPWAMRNKQWKKRFYAALFERANIAGAACLHALTHAEADDYRKFGSTGPIAVIPNAVHIPESLDDALFFDTFPTLRGKRIIVFLGRVHYKKGLDLLVESWAALAKRWPEAHLVIAGPDSGGTLQRVKERIRTLEIADRVLFTGMLDHAMKWSALAAAQCFILPSYSEGLSTSVLEAMAVGLPVIITENCHMPEVAEYRCGWVIQARVDDIHNALTHFLNNSEATNGEVGARGKHLVQSRYSWSSVGERVAEIYQWLAGGQTPTSVDLIVRN